METNVKFQLAQTEWPPQNYTNYLSPQPFPPTVHSQIKFFKVTFLLYITLLVEKILNADCYKR